MALPKIDSPTFTLKLPSSQGKKTIKYRPFTVKEEKILLMAAQSQEQDDVVGAIKQIINNCLLTKTDIDELPTYDIEYIFKHLRARSVNNIVELSVKDDVDDEYYDVQVDLDEVEVVFDPDHNYVIQVTKDISIMMKDPSYNIVQKIASYENDEDGMMEMIVSCIDQVIVGEDEVVLMKDHTRKEQEDFINSLSSQNMRDIEVFLNTLPKLSHSIKYTREDGTEVEKKIEGMQSFFT